VRQQSLKQGKSKRRTRKPESIPENEIFLQPWYLPREVYLEIRRILPNIHLSKMHYYFEDYGCLKCAARDSLYGSNGLCERCSVLIRGRVVRALKRRLKNVGVLEPENTISNALGDGMASAQDLLHHLTSRRPASR
jgi:hypothetical protein